MTYGLLDDEIAEESGVAAPDPSNCWHPTLQGATHNGQTTFPAEVTGVIDAELRNGADWIADTDLGGQWAIRTDQTASANVIHNYQMADEETYSGLVWFKASAVGAGQQTLWRHQNGGQLQANLTLEANELRFFCRVSGSESLTTTSGGNVVADQWYSAIFTRDGGEAKVYLNAVEVGSASTTVGAIASGTAVWRSGDATDTGVSHFDGRFDKWCLYDGVILTQEQINAIHAEGRA